MFKIGDEIHETAEEARDGVDVKGMTSELFVSLAMIVVLLAGTYQYWAS